MTACYSIITAFICLSVFLQLSPGYEVIQPKTRTVDPDGSFIITCEHDAKGTLIDARLSSVSEKKETKMLCQIKGRDCKNIIIYNENTYKYFFILLNNGPDALSLTYQCRFTVDINDRHVTEEGTPTVLLPDTSSAAAVPCEPPQPHNPEAAPLLTTENGGQKEAAHKPQPQTPPECDKQRWTLLEFILLALLALTLLYSCVFTCYHIRQRGHVVSSDPENSTYVDMRTVHSTRNQEGGPHCG